MTETTLPAPAKPKPRSQFRSLRDNPVVLKELRSRMRGNRAFIILTVYVGLISALVAIVYISFVSTNDFGFSPDTRQIMGKTIFGLVVLAQLGMISFVAPGLTAGAISSERERQTFDLLRTTLLPGRSLVRGKLLSALVYLLLLLFAALPLQSIAFLFGGVELAELLISTLMLVVTTIAFCCAGLFFSSIVKRTLPSTVLAYAFSNLLLFGLPFMVLTLMTLLIPIIEQAVFSGSNEIAELFFLVIAWLLVSVNPFLTAIVSEVLLIDQGDLFFSMQSVGPFSNFPVPSPWIIYCIIFLVISFILYQISVSMVTRKEV